MVIRGCNQELYKKLNLAARNHPQYWRYVDLSRGKECLESSPLTEIPMFCLGT